MSNLDRRVLVVDDQATMRRIIVNLLKQLGFKEIEEAADGREALSKLSGGSFKLVLSDWNMEPMHGLELLKSVRSDAAIKDVPFIMVTAEQKAENVMAAKEAGVNNYIVKPFNQDTLKKKLEAVIGPLK